MPRKKSIQQEDSILPPLSANPNDESSTNDADFDPSFLKRVHEMTALGLTPASALDLLMDLITQVPDASKSRVEKLKMLDKFLNTARSMMELRLKTEEAEAISQRLDEMETRLVQIAGVGGGRSMAVTEVWHGRSDDQ